MMQLPNGVKATAISAGALFSLAIGDDGKVYAAGANYYGALGNGTLTDSNTPVVAQLPNGINAIAISAGYYHNLAIGSDGNVYAWGGNSLGQLGDGTTSDSTIPVVALLPDGVSATAISAGYYHSLAIGSDGNVYAWGQNNKGQLGDGTNNNSDTPVVVQMPNGVSATAVAASYIYSLALGNDGKVYAWGFNNTGQLGNGTLTDSNVPVVVQMPNGVTPTAISAGYNHSLAIGDDGKAYAWGGNLDGELGIGISTRSTTPVVVQLPNGVTPIAISSGNVGSLAIGDDNKVYAWGNNDYGQLGDGTTTSRHTPVVMQLPGDTLPEKIAAGFTHNLLILNPVEISINNVTQAEGNTGTTDFDFTVTLSHVLTHTVSVDYATSPGTATAPSDFIPTSGTVTFASGQLTQTISIPVIGDNIVEPDDTFTVTLSNPNGAVIDTATGTGTILNDDVPPGTSVTTLQVSPAEAAPGQPVTIQVNILPTDATGSVILADGATILGTAPVVGGMATFVLPFDKAGTHPLVATYSGDGTHTGSASAPFALVIKAPSTYQPPADLVAQLRQTPDRVASNAASTDITYSFTVKNIGEGKAGAVSLALPIDPKLSVGYASFGDKRLWVTSVTANSINITVPDLWQGQSATGTIVLHPISDPQPSVGSSVSAQASVRWTNPGGGDKQVLSNRVSFTFGEANSELDVSGGQVQLMNLDTSTAGKAVATGDFWIPDEPVSAWLTNPDGTSVAISQGSADANGSYAITVDTTGLAAGTYVIAAYGQRSEVYGSAVLTVEASGDSQGQSAAKLNLKALGNKALVKAR